MKLYKGSVYPINVAFAPCYCQDPEVALTDLVLNFFTTEEETSIEFSGDSITIDGFVATVVFQPAQLDALEDGVLRFVSEFNYGGSAMKWSCATDKYLVTPPAYTPIDIVTEDKVEEIVAEQISASTAITEIVNEAIDEKMEDYYTSAQTESAISEAITEALVDYVDEVELSDAMDEKQNVLTPGEGISISGDTISCTVSGGGDSNYVIVEALSAITTPAEGMIAYVSGHTWTQTIQWYKCSKRIDTGTEGDVFRVYVEGNEVVRVYQSGPNFSWDWTNDGSVNIYNREYNGRYYPIQYKTYNDHDTYSNSYFLIERSFGGLDALGAEIVPEGDPSEPIGIIVEYNEEVPRFTPGKFYQYIGGTWQELDLPNKIVLDELTDAQRAALFTKIQTLKTSEGGEYRVNEEYEFYAYFKENSHYDSLIKLQFIGTSDDGTWVIFNTCFTNMFMGDMILSPYFRLYSDGHFEKNRNEWNRFNMTKLSLLRDREYLRYDGGTYTGYTLDLSNVPAADTLAVDYYDPSWSWLFKVVKGHNSEYRDGDGNNWNADGQWHLKQREDRCVYNYKLTGDTFTVLFKKNGPASVSDLNLDASVSYTAVTESVSLFTTNVTWQDETFYTGDTPSGQWAFEVDGMIQYCDGYDAGNKNPNCAFLCTSGLSAENHYSCPTIYYERITPITVIVDGQEVVFDYKFYFDYGEYVVSLVAAKEGYRYMRLTVTKTPDYVTSAQTKEQIEGYHYTTSAETKTQIEGYNYTTSAETQSAITSALTDYITSAETAQAISVATTNMVTSTYVNNIWVGTTAQYSAITTKDPQTLYFINDN